MNIHVCPGIHIYNAFAYTIWLCTVLYLFIYFLYYSDLCIIILGITLLVDKASHTSSCVFVP